jgi:hypothetical protein
MATPADQRLLDLLGRWLESLELHTKYSSLDDDSYWKIQPWSEHQRPSLWILNLAKQKTLALRAHVEERVKTGDARFSDALELMAFLANLVGSEHLERFIPVADKANERILPSATSETTTTTTAQAPVSVTATREMPKFLAAKRAAPPASTPQVARNERKTAAAAKPALAARPAPKAQAKPAAKKPQQPEREGQSEAARDQVIADATRLVQWGRRWFELPELIARMADRPALPDVRRILKENKSAIEKKAGTT